MSQLICHSKNSITNQSKWHDIHFILILNEACDLSYSFNIHILNKAHDFLVVRTQLCSLILSELYIWERIELKSQSFLSVLSEFLLFSDSTITDMIMWCSQFSTSFQFLIFKLNYIWSSSKKIWNYIYREELNSKVRVFCFIWASAVFWFCYH